MLITVEPYDNKSLNTLLRDGIVRVELLDFKVRINNGAKFTTVRVYHIDSLDSPFFAVEFNEKHNEILEELLKVKFTSEFYEWLKKLSELKEN